MKLIGSSVRMALLTGTALVAIGGQAFAATTAITTTTDLDTAGVAALDDASDPVVTINAADVTVSADYTHGQSANEDIFSFVTAGDSSLTIASGVTVTSDSTGDLVIADDLDGLAVNVSGALTASSAAADALNFSTLTGTNNVDITVTGSATAGDGAITGVITGGAGADTIALVTTAGDVSITGAVDLGAGTDAITLTGTNTASFSTTVAAETITLSGAGTLDLNGALTGAVALVPGAAR